MTDDLIEEMRIMADEHDDNLCRFALDRFALLEEAIEQYRTALTQSTSRIEALEAALRRIACDGEPYDKCHCVNSEGCSYGIARAALGEKKDD